VSYRLIDHEPEGRTDKVSAMRATPSPRARLPPLALSGLWHHGSITGSSQARDAKFTGAESQLFVQGGVIV
jgi:hypothetical protein